MKKLSIEQALNNDNLLVEETSRTLPSEVAHACNPSNSGDQD
jgi:hypothetical protein